MDDLHLYISLLPQTIYRPPGGIIKLCLLGNLNDNSKLYLFWDISNIYQNIGKIPFVPHVSVCRSVYGWDTYRMTNTINNYSNSIVVHQYKKNNSSNLIVFYHIKKQLLQLIVLYQYKKQLFLFFF